MTNKHTPATTGQAAALPKTYTQHPLNAALPALPPEQYQALMDSINNIGVVSPITILDGQILDGWNRYTAARDLGMACPEIVLDASISPSEYIEAQNTGRTKATAPSKHQRIDLKLLRSSAQPRPLITADVDRLAASIKQVGLIQPITVRVINVINGVAEQGFQIVAGHHRVAACRSLGWTAIDAIVVANTGHLDAELIEIDENLFRSELSPSQRSHYTARRKQIWETLHPVEIQVGQIDPPEFSIGREQVRQLVVPVDVAKHGRAQEKEFAASTAEITGENVRSIQRHIARAEAIGDGLLRTHGTSLDKGVELDALAKLPEQERTELIERAATGEKVTARKPTVVVPPPNVTPAVVLATMDDGNEEDGAPSEAEIAEALAAEEDDRKLMHKMLESDDVVATLHAEVKKLQAEVRITNERFNGLMNTNDALNKLLKKRDWQMKKQQQEINELRKQGGAA